MLLDFGYDIENKYYATTKFAIAFNIIFIALLSFFALVNFNKGNHLLSSGEFVFLIGLTLSLLYFLKYKNTKFFLLFTTLSLFSISLVFHFNADKTLYSALYLLFFPLIAFLLNGLRIGRVLTITYCVIISIDVYLGIGVYTDIYGFLHIFIALITFSLISYLIEYSRKVTYKKMIDAIKHLEIISNVDSLTQFYNRNYLNTVLSKNNFQNQSLLFCLTDIDNFKAYNDFYGHQKGDEALKSIASIKNDIFSQSEKGFVVRLGGEEFGGFIYDVSNPKAYVDAFFDSLKDGSFEHKNNAPYDVCTVSVGAVYCQNNCEYNFEQLYQLADKALYEAKAKGRNNVVWKQL